MPLVGSFNFVLTHLPPSKDYHKHLIKSSIHFWSFILDIFVEIISEIPTITCHHFKAMSKLCKWQPYRLHNFISQLTHQVVLVSMSWLCDLSPHLRRSSCHLSSFHRHACKQLQHKHKTSANVNNVKLCSVRWCTVVPIDAWYLPEYFNGRDNIDLTN